MDLDPGSFPSGAHDKPTCDGPGTKLQTAEGEHDTGRSSRVLVLALRRKGGDSSGPYPKHEIVNPRRQKPDSMVWLQAARGHWASHCNPARLFAPEGASFKEEVPKSPCIAVIPPAPKHDPPTPGRGYGLYMCSSAARGLRIRILDPERAGEHLPAESPEHDGCRKQTAVATDSASKPGHRTAAQPSEI